MLLAQAEFKKLVQDHACRGLVPAGLESKKWIANHEAIAIFWLFVTPWSYTLTIAMSVPRLRDCKIQILGDWGCGKEAFSCAFECNCIKLIGDGSVRDNFRRSVTTTKCSCDVVVDDTSGLEDYMVRKSGFGWLETGSQDVLLFCCREDDASTLEHVRNCWVPEACGRCRTIEQVVLMLLCVDRTLLGRDREGRAWGGEQQVTPEMLDAAVSELRLDCWMYVNSGNYNDVVIRAVDLWTEKLPDFALRQKEARKMERQREKEARKMERQREKEARKMEKQRQKEARKMERRKCEVA